MSELDFDNSFPALEVVLECHFPDIETKDIADHAEVMRRSASFNKAFEEIDHANTDPGKDRACIAKAASHLEKATKLLGQVGWHGQKTLSHPLEEILSAHKVQFGTELMSNHKVKGVLLEHIQLLGKLLTEASEKVNVSGMSVITPSGEFNSAKPKKLFARYVAIDCAKLFQELTTMPPKVRTESSSGKAYGPFLDFVSDVFEALEISASPEVWARAAEKEFSIQIND
jgi:hypothetical protein